MWGLLLVIALGVGVCGRALALEGAAARWAPLRESQDAGEFAEITPARGAWVWKPVVLGTAAYRAEGQATWAEQDGVRFGSRFPAEQRSRGAWTGGELGGALGLGSGLTLDWTLFGQARSDRAASGRVQELALRWNGGRYAVSLGKSRPRWGAGQSGALLLGRSAPPRWQIHGWTRRPLAIPWVGTKWSGSVFLSPLEDPHSEIPDPLLFGQRLSWHPTEWLELSGTRTILFGGEDRTSRLTPRDLWHIFTGTRENLPRQERSIADSDQRASFTIRAEAPEVSRIWKPLERLEGFYEYAGEDMLHPPLPSAVAHHMGVAAQLHGWAASAEYAETVTGFNRWYFHIIYGREAYAYRGFLLGIPQGGDSRTHRWSLWTPDAGVRGRITRMQETFGEHTGNNERRVTWEV